MKKGKNKINISYEISHRTFTRTRRQKSSPHQNHPVMRTSENVRVNKKIYSRRISVCAIKKYPAGGV